MLACVACTSGVNAQLFCMFFRVLESDSKLTSLGHYVPKVFTN